MAGDPWDTGLPERARRSGWPLQAMRANPHEPPARTKHQPADVFRSVRRQPPLDALNWRELAWLVAVPCDRRTRALCLPPDLDWGMCEWRSPGSRLISVVMSQRCSAAGRQFVSE